jgi:hypothetical protein
MVGGSALLLALATALALRASDRHHAALVPAGWLRPLIMAALLGGGLVGCGLGVRRRAARWGVLLAGSPWRAVRLTYLPAPRRGGFAGVELAALDEAESRLLLRLGPTFKWRGAGLRAAHGQIVWLAGEPGSHRVLGVPPGPELFPVGSPWPRQLARYRRVAAQLGEHGRPTEFERRAAVRRAFRAAQLRALLLWLEASLLTIARASLIGVALVVVFAMMLGETLVRTRRAREEALLPRASVIDR